MNKATICGISFPLEINATTGNLKTSEDAGLIADHIIHYLLVEVKENPMRPRYGTDLQIFESEDNFDAFASEVGRRLEGEIPQANFRVSGELGDEGRAYLLVQWEYLGDVQEDIRLEL